jgi:hypothetical protein
MSPVNIAEDARYNGASNGFTLLGPFYLAEYQKHKFIFFCLSSFLWPARR